MLWLFALWLAFGVLSVGVTGFHFLSMIRASNKPWQLKIDSTYSPKVTFLVPTYNESAVIKYKLINMAKVDYPKELMQILIVDSKSTDSTIDIVNDFIQQHPELNIQVLSESTRKGKAAALNQALKHVTSELVIVSDADCLYQSDVLKKSLPYLADPKVGAISGPKLLLNFNSSKTAQNEKDYLASMNKAKLGESKHGFTPLFEGGFSAYKKDVLESFDPYKTGSDDCGTIIKLAENSYEALFVSEAAFYTTFPISWKERLSIKLRRGNQLLRVFMKYLELYRHKKVKTAPRVVLSNIFVYLVCPSFFILFMIATVGMLALYPLLTLSLLLLLIPKVRQLSAEVFLNYILLFISSFSVLLKRNFLIWKQPADRQLFTEEMLRQTGLI
ncbi:MAG: glycosyltransferase [Candidatus Bathyarchaeia archaeon]|jgi:cellulose synthase/poly-beta-1,6-N-acetylglucosamine synthase-like glycosyltransferase